MTITYDTEANAAYIYINNPSNMNVSKTVPVTDDIIVDFGSKGELLGIEILNASKHMANSQLGSNQVKTYLD
jgi:uncharacterized protein YuzE